MTRIVIILLIQLNFIAFFSSAAADSKQLLDSLLLKVNKESEAIQKADIWVQASQVALQLNLHDDALKYAENALAIATKSKLVKPEIQALIALSTAYFKFSDNKQAFIYALRAKEMSEKKSFSLESAEASLLLSKLYYNIGEYDKSIELAYATIDNFEQAGNYQEQCDALNMIGINYMDNNNDSLARKYFEQTIEISREHSIYIELGTSTINLAITYAKNRDLLQGVETMKLGFEILHKYSENVNNIAVGYCNISTAYLDLNQPDSAFVYLKKAQALSEITNNTRNLAIVNLGLADYYKHIKYDQEFLKHIYQAFYISDNSDLKLLKLKSAEDIEYYYMQNKVMDSAYKYKTIRFELINEMNSLNISTKLAQFELLKELEILEKERIFRADKKALYNVIIIISLLFLLILFLVLILRYRIKVKYSILKQEKLKDEIYYKNKESTVSLMELMKKNELLSDVTKELINLSNNTNNERFKNSTNRIALKIEKITKGKIWEEFTVRFQQVHSDFYKNLSERFPDLTANEQRLCAFLKLNLSTKEISSITGQSERAITMARYRLRKKMGIESQEINLTAFVSTI
jgi:hypothetical protein